MVKKVPTKAELRAALEQETRQYLKQGGKVETVPPGTTGADPTKPRSFHANRIFTEPKGTRTFLPEVVAAIESRRSELKRKRRNEPRRSRLPKQRRKTIYDDFGEPLRKVWVEE
jgi:hypothetical protein